MDGVIGLQFTLLNSPIIIDHHRSPTLREAIDFSITSHFQMASTVYAPHGNNALIQVYAKNEFLDSGSEEKAHWHRCGVCDVAVAPPTNAWIFLLTCLCTF